MKFAYFSASPIMKYGLMDGLEKNGQETKLFPMVCMGDDMVTVELDGKSVRISYNEQELINGYIDKCIAQYQPDYIFLEGYQGELAQGIYLACHKYGCGFIYWSIEDPVGFTRTLPVAKVADIVFTTAVECLPEYRKQGINAHLLLFGCNPDYNQSGVYRPQYNLDFAVQASWYNFNSRVDGFNILLKPLLNLGLKYRIWGYNWDNDPQARAFLGDYQDHYAGILSNAELPDLCASTKIILGFQCDSSSITQTSMRNFEVLSCGGFYLCQYTKASAHIFQERTHLELVKDEAEAVSKVLYYLAHDQERTQIARQGQEFVQSRHSYEVRVREDVLPFLRWRAEGNRESRKIKLDTSGITVEECPICGQKGLSIYFDYGRFRLIQCEKCQLIFQEPLQEMESTRHIDQTYDAGWVTMRRHYLEDTFLQHASFNTLLLEIFCPKKGALLEIGSGTGEFLYMAQDAGWKITGFEPSPEACRFARDSFGIKLVNRIWGRSAFEEVKQLEPEQKFEAIVFWHVLEHIPEPIGFLQEISLLLKPEGKIFFSIPNKDSFTNSIYGPNSPLFMETDHLFHYNRANLSLLLERVKLKPVSLFSREGYQQMKSDLDAYLKRTNRTGQIAIEDSMGIMARLQAKHQGHELFCVAEKQ